MKRMDIGGLTKSFESIIDIKKSVQSFVRLTASTMFENLFKLECE